MTLKDTFNKFLDWSGRNHTHLDRHLSILNRQTENMYSFVALFRTYPANSIEFKVEVERLYENMKELVDELHETNQGFANDCHDFSEILTMLRQDFLELRNERKRTVSS